MEPVKLDLNPVAQIVRDDLPEKFDKFMTQISAKEGTAYKVSSFQADGEVSRCAIVNKDTLGWFGKCECDPFSKTKETDSGKVPCVHLAGALWIQSSFDSSLVFKEANDVQNDSPQNTIPTPPVQTQTPSNVSPPSQAVVPRDPAAPPIVAPIATVQQARESIEAFQNCKISLLNEDDVQAIKGKTFIKKSGWRKVQLFFGVSCQKLCEGWVEGAEIPLWFVTYRALAACGQFQDATGYCSWQEGLAKGKENAPASVKAKLEHDVRATAETRAKNRAISDLVGGGEVSAEEMRSVTSRQSNSSPTYTPDSVSRPEPNPFQKDSDVPAYPNIDLPPAGTQGINAVRSILGHGMRIGWSEETLLAWIESRTSKKPADLSKAQAEALLTAIKKESSDE